MGQLGCALHFRFTMHILLHFLCNALIFCLHALTVVLCLPVLLQPEAGCCGHPLCPCSMSSWEKRRDGPVRVLLPNAPDGVTLQLPDYRVMPDWRRRQMQQAIV